MNVSVALDNQDELERIRVTFLLKLALSIKSVEDKLKINMFEREINRGNILQVKYDRRAFRKFNKTQPLNDNTIHYYFVNSDKILEVVHHNMNCFQYFYPENVFKSIMAYSNEQSVEEFEHATVQIKNTFRFNSMMEVYVLFLKKFLWNEFVKTINLFRFDFIKEIQTKSRTRLVTCACGKKVKSESYRMHLKTKSHQLNIL